MKNECIKFRVTEEEKEKLEKLEKNEKQTFSGYQL